MHSKIFQLEKEPIPKEDHITSNDIPDWFYDSIADYTRDDFDREENIQWLLDTAIGAIVTRDGDKITFASDISKFFESKHKDFIESAKKLSEASFEGFVDGYEVGYHYCKLMAAYDDKYGFYVYFNDWPYTLDDFMRRMVKPGDDYYIGGIIDYHF